MSYRINQIFSDLEQDLIASYKRSMEKNSELADSAWQRQKLLDLQEYRREVIQITNEYIKQATQVASKEIQDNFKSGQDLVDKRFKDLTFTESAQDFNKINRRKLTALISTIKQDFTKAATAAVRLVDDQYRQIVFKAQVYYSAGAVTLPQAIDLAAQDFLHSGINCVQYKNGRKVNVATYAEMAIRTGNKNAYLTGEGARMAEWGQHLVQVTSYGGCSDTCLPWQGKVYFDDVYSGGVPDKDNKYPLLSTALASGLYHPNCRHTHNPWFEGISTLPEEFDEERVREVYEAEQKQRSIERKIREWKRIEEGSITPENRQKAELKVKAWQSAMRTHIKDNPFLSRKYWREQV